MKALGEIFELIAAKSGGVDDYEPGLIPLITSAELSNGVVAYVNPEPDDRVFSGPALVVSGLGFATVQLGKFLPKGNGGDSLTVLKPKSPLTVENLISTAAAFNVLHKWRFGFGRKASKDRLTGLAVPFPPHEAATTWQHEKTSLDKLTTYFDKALATVAAGFSTEEVAMSSRSKERDSAAPQEAPPTSQHEK